MTRNEDESGSPTAQPLAGRELRVLAMNLWHSGTKVAGGTELIADLIVSTRASIVLLSEATTATADVAAELARRGYEFNAVSSPDTGILTVFPIEDSADLRWMVKARLTIDGKRLTVYSAHLEFRWYAANLPRGYGPGVPPPDEFAEYNFDKIPSGPVTDPATIRRVNTASGRPEVISALLTDAKAELAQGSSVIIAGDLNEPSALDWTPATADMFDHNGVTMAWESTRLLHEAGFIDAYRSMYPDPVTHPGLTWPADNAEVDVAELAWAPEADERDRVDFVFAHETALSLSTVGIVGPRGSIVRGARQPETTQDNFAASPPRWCSDHKGILATYRFTG
ncbi:endonuclease/exonuclease/phosphatase family protein [Nocardia sp. NPDC057030]|uniref:endonuclease/exonuclease/phosphatase family protein n=1 Tax=unclassified Nocardia TaxID=2637762 RepID=UPI003635971B